MTMHDMCPVMSAKARAAGIRWSEAYEKDRQPRG